jgi:hypothetical protein
LAANNFTELQLDSCFRREPSRPSGGEAYSPEHIEPILPDELFTYCPNVKILSLRHNGLEKIPAAVGKLKHLCKLVLTDNRLGNRSIPSTLALCQKLEELYLDHNLLDGLPGFLLSMKSLQLVHRHGNHNYFKSTFMWYHTDLNDRVTDDLGVHQSEVQWRLPRGSLQEASALTAVGARTDIFASYIAPKLQALLAEISEV